MDILGGISADEIEVSSSVPIPGNDLFDADFVKNLFTVTETRWNPWYGLIRIFWIRSKTVLPASFSFVSNQSLDSGKNKINITRITLLAPMITTKSLKITSAKYLQNLGLGLGSLISYGTIRTSNCGSDIQQDHRWWDQVHSWGEILVLVLTES